MAATTVRLCERSRVLRLDRGAMTTEVSRCRGRQRHRRRLHRVSHGNAFRASMVTAHRHGNRPRSLHIPSQHHLATLLGDPPFDHRATAPHGGQADDDEIAREQPNDIATVHAAQPSAR